jgi:hypothetical protein
VSSIEEAIAGCWSTWQGLAAGTTEHDVERAMRTAGGDVHSSAREWGRLAGQQVATRTWRRDEPPTRVQVWFDGIGQAVVLAELRRPRTDVDADDLEGVLGKPDLVGLPRRLVAGRVEERVWWRRGIAVTLVLARRGSTDHPSDHAIGLVQVFEPTDRQGWVIRLGGDEVEGPSPSPRP